MLKETHHFQLENRIYTYDRYVNEQALDTIILFHGFTGTKTTWDHLAQNLQTQYEVIAFDLPGHGETSQADDVSMDEFADHMAQWLDKEEINSAIFLGYSLGGRTALSFATYYPARVKALVLESASPGLAKAEERESRVQQDTLLAERIRTEGLRNFVDFWENIPLFASQKNLPVSVQEKIRNERLAQRPEGLAQSLIHMGTGAQRAWWDTLSRLELPVLLMTGQLDHKFVGINEEMEKRLPLASHQIIEAAGHTIHIEKPAEFTKQVINFLQDLNEK